MSRNSRWIAVGLGASCVAPVLYLVALSIAGPWPYPDLLPRDVRFDRWTALLSGDHDLLGSALTSVTLASAVGLLSAVLGLFIARAVASHPYRRGLTLTAHLPLAISPVILGVCLLYFLIRLDLAATLAGVMLSHLVFALAFAVVFWLPFWNAEKRAYEDLVRTLGGGTRDFYARVVFPLTRGPFVICFFQTFLISWFQYGLTVLVGSGKVRTLPLEVYEYVAEANLGYAAVASCLLVLPPVLLGWLNLRIARRLS